MDGADGTAGGPAAGMPAAGPDPSAGPPQTSGVDESRRQFFRQFLSDAVQAAAAIVGAASALQETSNQAATALLNLPQSAALDAPADQLALESSAVGYRSPFRLDGDRLVILDQRQFPARVVEIECRTGAETASLIRQGAIIGPAAIAQAAACGLSLTVSRSATSSLFARRAIIRGSAQALQNAAPTVMLLQRAMTRMIDLHDDLDRREVDPQTIAARLREEADAIVLETTHGHARLAEVGRRLLPEVGERRVRVLLYGPVGPLACGQVGSAFGILQAAAGAGVAVQAWVAETRPSFVGSRLVAWELAQAGIPYVVLADSAVGWLLASGQVDTILVGAARVAANGDAIAETGTYPIAALAARHAVPLHVCVPVGALDARTATGADVVPEMREGRDVAAVGGTSLVPAGSELLEPAYDVTPGELVTSIVTEHGVLAAPYPDSIRGALELAGLDGEGEGEAASAEPPPGEAARDGLGVQPAPAVPGSAAPGPARGHD